MADHYGLIDKGFYCCDGLGFLVFAQLTLGTSAENLLHQISRKQISIFIYYWFSVSQSSESGLCASTDGKILQSYHLSFLKKQKIKKTA